MAGEADGRIIVVTELDPKGFEAGSKELRQAIKSLVSQVNGLEPTVKKAAKGSADALQTFNTKAAGLETTITALRDKLSALGTTKVRTEDYQRITEETEKAGKKLEELLTKQERLKDLGVRENSVQWRRLQYDLEAATRKYEELEAVKRRYEEEGRAFRLGSDTEAYQRLKADLEAATASLQRMREQAEGGSSGGGRLASIGERIKSALSGAASKARQLSSTLARVTMSHVISGARRLKATLASILGTTKRLILGNKEYEKSFKKLTKYAKKFTLSLLGVKSVWMILKKAVSSYMSANEELATTQKRIWASLGSILGPAIERVIGFVAKAVSYLSAFLHLLGFTSKSATTAINKSSKKAQKETKKLENQLAAFDELDILSDNKSNDKDDDDTGETPITPLEDAELPDWAKELADLIKSGKWYEAGSLLATKLNEAVDMVDWDGIGAKFAEGFNNAVQFLLGFLDKFDFHKLGSSIASMINRAIKDINWYDFGRMIAKLFGGAIEFLIGFIETLDAGALSQAIIDFIHGAIDGVDWVDLATRLGAAINGFIMDVKWAELGTAIGEGLDMAFKTIGAFMDQFDFIEIGHKFAEGVNGILYAVDWNNVGKVLAQLLTFAWLIGFGFLENLDWAQLAIALSDFAIGFFDQLREAISQVDWEQLGRDIVIFLENIKWAEVLESLSKLLGTVVGSVFSFLRGLLSEAWDNFVEFMTPYAFKNGKFTILGFLEGIVEGFKNIFNWIKEHIVDPFIDAFKKAFGIASPSKVMKEYGGYIVDGIKEGIKSGFSKIASWVKSHVFKPFVDAINSVFEISAKISRALKTIGGYIIDGLKEGIKTAWTAVQTLVKEKAQAVFDAFKEKYEKLHDAGTTLINRLKSGMENTWGAVQTKLSNFASAVETSFNNKVSSLYNAGASLMNSLHSGLYSVWGSISTTLSNCARNIYDTFFAYKDSMSNVGQHLMSGLQNGIVGFWNDYVVGTVSKIAQSVSDTFASVTQEHSPSKVWRRMGEYLMAGLEIGMDDETRPVLSTVAGIASAITDEMKLGEFSLNNSMPSAIDRFGNVVTDKLTALMDCLEAIADRVTFMVPATANGATPYQVASAVGSSAYNSTGAGTDDDIASVVIQVVNNAVTALVRAIEENSGTTVNLDKESLTEAVVEEINRKTRMTGTSPLLV